MVPFTRRSLPIVRLPFIEVSPIIDRLPFIEVSPPINTCLFIDISSRIFTDEPTYKFPVRFVFPDTDKS